MAVFVESSARGALLVALVVTFGCGEEKPTYGPPQTADTSTLQQGGGGGAGTGGSSGGTGGVPSPCQCAFQAGLGDPACTECFNAQGPNGHCQNEIAQCNFEQECIGFLHCPASCNGKQGAALTACVEACFASPVDPQTYQHFKALMECICPYCAQKCATSEVIACP